MAMPQVRNRKTPRWAKMSQWRMGNENLHLGRTPPASTILSARKQIAYSHTNHPQRHRALRSTSQTPAPSAPAARTGSALGAIPRPPRRRSTRPSKTASFSPTARIRSAPSNIRRCHFVGTVQTARWRAANSHICRQSASSTLV